MRESLKPHREALPAGLTMKDAAAWISTWFGAGLLRPAPGTIGSLAAIPFGYAIFLISGYTGLLIATLLLLFIGIKAAHLYGEKSGKHDDQSIVVDEVVGLWIAAIPAGDNLWLWLVAFFLFRLFDVWKPWPASFFNKRCKGGFDVVMDDVVAGIYAMLGVAFFASATLKI